MIDNIKSYPIPGSKYWRVWCRDCGAPMRASKECIRLAHYCEKCWPRDIPIHTRARGDVNPNPYYENALRAMEDM